MGLLGFLGDVVKGAGRIATGIIPGTLDDRLFEAGVDLVSGGGGRGRSNLPVPVSPPIARQPQGGGLVGPRGSGSFIEPSPLDFGPVQVDPFQLIPQGGPSGSSGVPAQGFQGALVSAMMAKSIRSKSGRAMLEAMVSGSLQGGMIQQTVTVDTPRGVENHSPPGFRTVYVMGEPYAVFKPLAEALNLLPNESKAVITRADLKCFSKADRLGKRLKGLTQKSGKYKVTNR